ncbi:MAG: MFS transporter [Tannerella sp.]|jgi:MFS family permease|nr:MFS transporter [Tannerella sp.]
MNNINVYTKARIRFAVLCFFLAQGLCFSSWASRIPDIKLLFSVGDELLWGMILFMIPAGKFIAIPLAGYLVSRLGSRIMVQASILGYAAALFGIGAVSNIYVLGISLFCFGIFWNLCDISLNTQGIGIERLFGRTIMATFHGGWSLAACLGALTGFLMIQVNVPPMWHFSIVATAIVLIVLFGRKYLQDDATQASPAPEKAMEKKTSSVLTDFVRHPEMLLIQLGIVSLFALIVESAMFDWSGLYFEEVIRAPKSMQIGFLVFMVMMTAGRFMTNYAYAKLGKQRVLQLAGLLIFTGFVSSGLFGSLFASMTMKVVGISSGFMLVGLGISCMVPTVYSLVGAKSKIPVGMALTILSSIGFIGSLIAPPLIGAISKTFNMQYAYIAVGLLGLCILLMTTFCKVFKTTGSDTKN